MTASDYPNNVGKRRTLKAIDGKKLRFTVIDEIIREQRGGPHRKLLYFQKIKHEPDDRIEYRLTYYMEGNRGRTKGRWVFGQYSLMIPARDLVWLLGRARKKGWKV